MSFSQVGFYFAQEPLERILGKNQQGPKDYAVEKIGEKLLYLSFDGFSRVIKDIEIVFNNRPFTVC